MEFFCIYVKITIRGVFWTDVSGGIEMYQVGSWVVYGVHGVCRIVGTEKQLVNRKRTQFFVLEPLAQSESRFYLPTDNPVALAKLRTVLSRDELTALLTSESISESVWIEEENCRKQYYRELIGSGDRTSLLKMVHSLYRYKASQTASGKKFHQADENFMRDAEKLLASEIALVMELSPQEAREYLRTQLRYNA